MLKHPPKTSPPSSLKPTTNHQGGGEVDLDPHDQPVVSDRAEFKLERRAPGCYCQQLGGDQQAGGAGGNAKLQMGIMD